MIKISYFGLSAGFLLWFLLIGCSSVENSVNRWIALEPGISLGSFKVDTPNSDSESDIQIVRFDPSLFDINIYAASHYGGENRSLSEWSEEFELVAAINAGMFATDLSTSIGFLKSGEHLNNPIVNQSYKCIFACQPLDSSVAPVMLIDVTCDDYDMWSDKYHSFSQSIRMISCDQQNVWEPKDEAWNIAALGVDKSGNLLFIYCNTPFSVHELINHLLELPISIENAMYLEGGFQAGMYLSTEKISRDFRDFSKSPLIKAEDSPDARLIPNIIGVKRIPSKGY